MTTIGDEGAGKDPLGGGPIPSCMLVTSTGGEGHGPLDIPPCMDPPDTGNGMAVLVTCCKVNPHATESEDSLQPFSSKSTLLDPFASKRGLSCESLEVLTSGDHLDDLSLSDEGSGQERGGSSQGSIPDCLEGEVKWEECRVKAEAGLDWGERGDGVKWETEGGLDQGRGDATAVISTVSERGRCPREVLVEEGRGTSPDEALEHPNSPTTVVEGM